MANLSPAKGAVLGLALGVALLLGWGARATLLKGFRRIAPVLSEATLASAPQPAPPHAASLVETIDCCLCKVSNGEDRLRSYRASCKPAGRDERECRQVRVQGNGCSFFKVTLVGGTTRCSPAKVTDWSGKVPIEVPRPPGLLSPCTEQTEESTENEGSNLPDWVSNDTQLEIYCSCGRDPGDPTRCEATRTEHGMASVLDSLPIPPGFDSCSIEACTKLYPREKFVQKCPKYVQGTP